MSATFNSIYSEFTTVTNSFTTTTCAGQFTIYIFSDTDPYSWMILDGVFLRKDSQTAEIFSDISRFQINLEKQDFPTNTEFSGSDWPLRLQTVRLNNINMNKYRAFNGAGTSDDTINFSYDFATNRWYLPSDSFIDPDGCVPFCWPPPALILSSNPATGVWNTYFQYAGVNTILARWVVEVNNSLLEEGQYHLTAWVDDFLAQQDERASAGDRTKMTLADGAASYTWQRFGTLDVIRPSLTINFIEWQEGDNSTGDYCPFRENGTPVTLSNAQIGIRAHGSGDSFVTTNINNLSSITLDAPSLSLIHISEPTRPY